jgi:hypothetical protein
MDERARKLADLASRDISTVSGSATVRDTRANAADVSWVVVTDDEQPVGVVSRKRLARAEDDQRIGDLIGHPAIVLPAHLSVAESLRSWSFHDLMHELTELDGVIVLADDDSPIGVWAGPDLDRFLPKVITRGSNSFSDTGLPGGITGIGRLIRLCRFIEQPTHTACAARRSFSAKPVPLPACKNPLQLTPHNFGW